MRRSSSEDKKQDLAPVFESLRVMRISLGGLTNPVRSECVPAYLTVLLCVFADEYLGAGF